MGKFAIGGFAAQFAALALLAHNDSSTGLLLGFLAVQALAAALTAMALWGLLPRRYRSPFGTTYCYLFAYCFFVPVGGILVCIGSQLVAWLFPRKPDDSGIQSVGFPEFDSHLVSRVTHGGGARLRQMLGNRRAPLPERMTALVAMQSMPARSASPVLRGLLTDSTDDIRLLAYGILDNAEKQLNSRILAELKRLETARDAREQAEINKRLADLYWELIYQNLVSGDIYDYTAAQAERYAAAALEADGNHAALWYMRGRLALSRREPEQARLFMVRAESLGFPRDRVLPMMAEAAYLEHDYAAVRAILLSFDSPSPLPLVRPLLRFWQS
jgi:hypothetical protein